MSQSIYSETASENGHFIVSLKFFKFITEEDVNKEQREVEIIRTVTFVDFEGFNSSLTDTLLHNRPVSNTSDPKNFSLISFKNLIESIATPDLTKYSEVNSILASLVTDLLRIQNSNFFFFGFINQNESSALESTVTLEIMNKLKNLRVDDFFEAVQEMNLDYSNIDNKYSKEEFHLIETIVFKFIYVKFSELLHYLEKSYIRKIKGNSNIEGDFYVKIKDLEQSEKFNYLVDHMTKINYNFEANIQVKNIFDSIINFFTNRSKWKNLYKAKDEILKLTANFKEIDMGRKDSKVMTQHSQSVVNETDELKVNILFIFSLY